MLEEQRNEAVQGRLKEGGESGQMAIEPEEVRAVDQAVEYINSCAIRSGPALAEEVGDYVLAAFFHGDYEEFADAQHSKPAAYRALVARQDLMISGPALATYVRISHQTREIPRPLVQALTLAQHRALLPMADPEHKEALARQAVAEGWTGERLQREVQLQLTSRRARRGTLPPMVESVREMIRTLDGLSKVAVAPERLEQMRPEGLEELAEKVDEVLERLVDLRESLVDIQSSLEQDPSTSGSPN